MLKTSNAEVILDWEAIGMLQKVFEDYCVEIGCHPESTDGRGIAEALANFFRRGCVSEDELQHAIVGHQLMVKASY